MEFKFRYLETPKEVIMSGTPKFVVIKTADGVGEITAGFAQNHKAIARDRKKGEHVVAAGSYDRDAQITSWDSFGFDLVTPMDLREPIQKVFLDHKAEVAADAWPQRTSFRTDVAEQDLSEADLDKLFK